MWYSAPATEELLQPIAGRLNTEGNEYSLRKGELYMSKVEGILNRIQCNMNQNGRSSVSYNQKLFISWCNIIT